MLRLGLPWGTLPRFWAGAVVIVLFAVILSFVQE